MHRYHPATLLEEAIRWELEGIPLGLRGHSCSLLSFLSSVLSVWFRTVTSEPRSCMRWGKHSSWYKSSWIGWLRAFTICMVLNRMSKELLVEEYSGSSVLFEPLDSGLAAPHALMQVVQGTSYIPIINVESSDVPLDTHSLAGAFDKVLLVNFPLVSLSCHPQWLQWLLSLFLRWCRVR